MLPRRPEGIPPKFILKEHHHMNWHDLGTLILLLSPGLLLSAIVMGIFAAGG